MTHVWRTVKLQWRTSDGNRHGRSTATGTTVVVSALSAVLVIGTSLVFAQESSGAQADADMDRLRTRTPAGAGDDKILDAWIAKELEVLEGAVEPQQFEAARTFRERFDVQMTNGKNTPEFTGRLAKRTAVAFAHRLSDCSSVSPAVGLAMAWVLSDAKHVGLMDGLAAGLRCRERPALRYLCAKGYAAIASKFADDRVLTEKALQSLRQAGEQETNGVVAAAIYEAMQFSDRTGEALAATVDILAARAKRRRQAQLPTCDGGELGVLEHLLKNPPTARSLSEKLVAQLAVMLRLDFERLCQQDVTDSETMKLATSIDLCESLLVKIVKPAPEAEPHIRREMKKPEDERCLQMEFELNRWIGTEDAPGVLNGSPWSVPVGAP